MKSQVIYFVFCMLVSCKTKNSEFSSKLDASCQPVIENFFKEIESNEYRGALDQLLSLNENINITDSGTISLKQKFYAMNQISGAYRGNSLLKRRFINDDIAIYAYLAKFDKKFYRFVFIFYNNGTSTKIDKFSFDDNSEVELEESIKLYL